MLKEFIDKWLEDHERSASYLARRVGCTVGTMHNWRHGRSEPNRSRGLALHRVTGIPLDVIFAEKEGRDDGKR